MPKARRKPHAPAAGEDWGSDTPAARRGTVLESVPGDANRRSRRRRLAPWEDPRGLAAKLSERQQRAAERLHEVHAATQRSPNAISVYVDYTPDHGLNAVIMADLKFKRAAVWRHVPTAYAAVVYHVCAEGRPLRCADEPYSADAKEAAMHTAELMVALDFVATAIGY